MKADDDGGDESADRADDVAAAEVVPDGSGEVDPVALGPDEVPAPVLVAAGLGVDGEHGPLFSGVDLSLARGLNAIRMPSGPAQDVLLLTMAGRFAPTRGTVSVFGDTTARTIRRHCAIAAFADIDELDESVYVRTVLTEQCRWLAPWYRRVGADAGRAELKTVFGENPLPSPTTFVVELSDLELFLLRVTLALLSDRPILVVGDLEQVRDARQRAVAAGRLADIAQTRTVVVGVTNPFPTDNIVDDWHEHHILAGGSQ